MPTGQQRVAAFVIFGVMLVVLADYPTTAPIAVGFAYLFLLSVLVLVGPIAFGRLQALIGATPDAPTGGGGGGGAKYIR